MGRRGQQTCAPNNTRPGPRFLVNQIVFGVIAILLEIACPLRRRGYDSDGDYHPSLPTAV